MPRLRLICLVLACLVVLTGPAHADATITVFPESGRYSLEMPVEWVSSQAEDANPRLFVGENISIAPDEAVLESVMDGKALGDGLTVTLIPIAQQMMFSENPVPLEDLSVRDRLDMGLSVTAPAEMFMIGEYQAAKARTASLRPPFADLPFAGVTAVLVDDFVYRIMYGSTSEEGLTALEAIAATFAPHHADATQLDLAALNQRPALNIDDAITMPLAPDWLVIHTPYAYSSITTNTGYFSFNVETSEPEQYLIIPDEQSAFLETYYSSMRTGESLAQNLTGLVIEVTAYPYDYKLRRADVEVTTERRENVLRGIIENIGRDNEGTITTRLINGVPVLSADVTTDSRVGQRDITAFHLVMIDVNYKFYVFAFAARAEQWQDQYAALVEAVDAGLNVNSFPLMAGGVPIGTQNGQQAPDFEATLADGTTVHLSDYRGKVVLLNFWASWCEPCVDEMPTLIEIAENQPEVVVLAINFEEDEATVKAFMEEHGLSFPVVMDVSGDINELYGIYAYPTNIVVDAEGIVYGRADHMSIPRKVLNAMNHTNDAGEE